MAATVQMAEMPHPKATSRKSVPSILAMCCSWVFDQNDALHTGKDLLDPGRRLIFRIGAKLSRTSGSPGFPYPVCPCQFRSYA